MIPGNEHVFSPSRPGGTVCVAERSRRSSTLDDSMPCGYPATHPIHRTDVNVNTESDEEYDARREAERPNPLHVLRGIIHGMITEPETLAAAEAALVELGANPIPLPVHPRIANTPAEARTGVSDRAAAALTDVAEVRRNTLAMCRSLPVSWPPAEMAARLDRIEAALRERVQ